MALGAGAALQVILLAFSLYFALIIPNQCSSVPQCFWSLNGLYLVAGLALGLLVVPWSRLRFRVLVFLALLTVGLALGLWNAFDLQRAGSGP
jgi:hypothetical protein